MREGARDSSAPRAPCVAALADPSLVARVRALFPRGEFVRLLELPGLTQQRTRL